MNVSDKSKRNRHVGMFWLGIIFAGLTNNRKYLLPDFRKIGD
jgi:hypothetical protein